MHVPPCSATSRRMILESLTLLNESYMGPSTLNEHTIPNFPIENATHYIKIRDPESRIPDELVEWRYRYEYSWSGAGLKLWCYQFEVIGSTEQGFWIFTDYSYGKQKKKWIGRGAIRSFAYPTKELALNSFAHRKRKEAEHLQGRLANVYAALRLVPREEQNIEKEKIIEVSNRLGLKVDSHELAKRFPQNWPVVRSR